MLKDDKDYFEGFVIGNIKLLFLKWNLKNKEKQKENKKLKNEIV